jgi:hypothetical protein
MLGRVGFDLIRYSTRSIFIELDLSSNSHFHYQIQTELARLLTGWIGFAGC